MEFMDRRSRSLLVQFWLTVESFKDPLESVDSASSDEDSDRDTTSALPLPSPTIKEDMSLIHDLYFSSPSPSPLFSAISRKHVDAIRSFASDPDPSTSHQRKVRKSVLLAQRQVEQDMEEDFADFEKSDLWFRAISAVERDVRTPLRPPSLIEPLASPPPSLRPMLSPTSSVNPPSTQQNTPPLSSERLSRSTSSLDRPRHHRGTAAADDSPKASNLHFLISSNSDLGSEIDSRSPLFGDADAHNEEAERMEAIEAALTDIIAQDMRYSGPGSTSSLDLRDKRSPAPRVERPAASIDRGSRIFLDDEPDVGEDDNHDDVVDEDDNGRRSMQLAAPGDLQLAHEIARLADKIGKLESQQIILDTLVRKAELTGDSNELRLLNKSKSAMTREMRELTFQKTQYEQQEANNRLIPERTRVAITNSVMTEEEGKQVVRYLIEVQQLATDGSFSSGWGVARRYSEFFVMNQRLRDRFVAVRNLDFPGKRLVTSLSNSFVDTRRSALEKYLQVSEKA
jgi:sorting nexin-25